MVVKVQVDKPESALLSLPSVPKLTIRYMDGSIADPNPALEEHVATVLGVSCVMHGVGGIIELSGSIS
jgi:hypothetical protein